MSVISRVDYKLNVAAFEIGGPLFDLFLKFDFVRQFLCIGLFFLCFQSSHWFAWQAALNSMHNYW